jgi:DNA-binding transcriptional regulator GbsR (MarR family)
MSLENPVDKAIDSLVQYNNGYDTQSKKNKYHLTETFENKKNTYSIFSLFTGSSSKVSIEKVIEAYKNVISEANNQGKPIKDVVRLQSAISGLNILKGVNSNSQIDDIIGVLNSWKESSCLEKKQELKVKVNNICDTISAIYPDFSKRDEKVKVVIALNYLNKEEEYYKKEPGADRNDFFQAFSTYFRSTSVLIKNKRELKIDISEDEILDTYVKCGGAIQLRELKSDLLIVGCGLGGCTDCGYDGCGSTNGGHEQDTVDSRLEMNPSVVASWGDEPQMRIFANRYKVIYDEGSVLAITEKEKTFWPACVNALKKDNTNGPNTVLIWSHVIAFKHELIPSLKIFKNRGETTINIGEEGVSVRGFELIIPERN